jgi:hypothetical protein
VVNGGLGAGDLRVFPTADEMKADRARERVVKLANVKLRNAVKEAKRSRAA